MDHPYKTLPARAFWRQAVSDLSALHLKDVYVPRFPIGEDMRIVAAGSCFAQHIGRQLKARHFNFIDVEPPPPLLPKPRWHEFGYDLYSARYGNLYSARQLLQLFQRAYGTFEPRESLWHCNGRYFDPFRPSIEPIGFASEAEANVIGERHFSSVRKLLPQTDVFVFTFGLTEAWVSAEDGAVYPACPGTVAGEFDPGRHRFHNFTVSEVLSDMRAFINLARSFNSRMKFLFTVSPVPLTATASGDHVLAATSYSKSALRAACGELRCNDDSVDYFPSYELIASHPMRAVFFEPNLRAVAPKGVEHVMDVFFAAHGKNGGIQASTPTPPALGATGTKEDSGDEDDLACDEEILAKFG